ncbi:unnamed protein product [Adineta ricciae]|uniref:Uncharacterized protein n=1 Tax=Adineta ricciae TaxID=249248 RepID=A0A816A1Y5_ADIRI|nr:unnamed protein product [Adineta ricciae]CAF1592273.1 unnamed protein product [Adineta ricciae]
MPVYISSRRLYSDPFDTVGVGYVRRSPGRVIAVRNPIKVIGVDASPLVKYRVSSRRIYHSSPFKLLF